MPAVDRVGSHVSAVTETVVKGAGTHVRSWVKTTVGTFLGLLSGAVVMWFSPLIDHFVRPAKPIANFSYQADGLSVTFENRSSGAEKAAWDFGDGSPLEFVPGDSATVTHTYRKPGRYMVKLSVRNLVDEVNERTAPIDLEAAAKAPPLLWSESVSAAAVPARPEIYDLSARPLVLKSPTYAPATFVCDANVDYAQHLIWDFGNGQGMQYGEMSRICTFDQPGTYQIRLAAFNGKLKAETVETITVEPPPPSALQFTVRTLEEGQLVSSTTRERVLSRTEAVTPKSTGGTLSVREPASPGARIVRAEIIANESQDVKDVVCFIAEDGQSLAVSGTIAPSVKLPSGQQPTALLSAKVRIVERMISDRKLESEWQIVTLEAPGQQQLRFPLSAAEVKELKRKYQVELRHGGKRLWKGDELPTDQPVLIGGQTFLVTASAAGNTIDVVVRPAAERE
jgi:PKD repeat protein